MITPAFAPFDVIVLDETTSTQNEARDRAGPAWQRPLWISAKRQSGGRGRRGRQWEDAPGNLAATFLHRLPGPRNRLAQLGFALGLSVWETLDETFGIADIRLKWPNDVLIGGAKMGGILLESWVADGGGEHEGPFWLAAGVGLNLASAPELPGYRTGSVLGDAGIALEPDAVLAVLARRFAGWSERLWREGFSPLAAAWTAHAAGLGETVAVDQGAARVTGRLLGLDADGALRLEAGEGHVLAIAAGDVMLPESGRAPAVTRKGQES